LKSADYGTMRYGKTLKIFVMGKEPRSLKSVELVNWTGLAYLGRREHLAQARKRNELNEPAVYLLLSDGAEDSGAIDIYVGETDNFAERLNSHAQSKSWWSQFIVFVSKDKNLTKAHVKYLECELYKLAHKAIGTLTVKNSVEPSGSSLPESDISAMSEFLENMTFVLESLGLSYFPPHIEVESPELQARKPNQISDPTSADGMEFYITLPRDLSPDSSEQPRSHMIVRDGLYILKSGSLIRKAPRESFVNHSYHGLWKQIVESDAVAVTQNSNLLKTTRDIEFRSPSGAGAIVRGGQTNGRTDWKRVTDDKPLFECESEADQAA
jgi:hypothetical protein